MSRSYQKRPYSGRHMSQKDLGLDSRRIFHKRYRSMCRQAIRNCKSEEDYENLLIPHYNQGWNLYDWPDSGMCWDSKLDALQEDDNCFADHNFNYYRKREVTLEFFKKNSSMYGMEAWKRNRRK